MIIIKIFLICLNFLDVSERVKNIEALKLKLSNCMDNEDWEADSIFEDHNYFKSPTVDCVVYYVCGYLIRQLSKRYVCERCLAFLRNTSSTSSTKSVASLTNIKSRGYLIHPNFNFFNIIKTIENSFERFCEDVDVFNLTVNDVLKTSISFPCTEHKIEVMSDILSYYITMRMRQYCYFKNMEPAKRSCKKKKLSKLVNT